MIGHTQPRRLAARTVAERIAEELGTQLGDVVGYQVRFTDQVSDGHADQADDRRHPAGRDPARPAAAPLRHDHHRRGARAQPQHRLPARLPQAAAAHAARTSRSSSPRRRSTRSASPRISATARPIVEVRPHLSGRDPLPAAAPTGRRPTRTAEAAGDQIAGASRDALEEIAREGPRRRAGVPAAASARSATPPTRCADAPRATPRSCRCTRGCRPPTRTACSTPHAGRRDRAGDQRRRDLADGAGHPLRGRPRHRAHQALQPAHEGAAAADRGDLAGVGAASEGPLRPRRRGICIRLYTEEDFAARPEFTDPEILRTNLAGGDPADGRARSSATSTTSRSSTRPTRGSRRRLRAARELGALGRQPERGAPGSPTIGRKLARLPVDLRLGAHAGRGAAGTAACARCSIITAALAIQDPRERPADARERPTRCTPVRRSGLGFPRPAEPVGVPARAAAAALLVGVPPPVPP